MTSVGVLAKHLSNQDHTVAAITCDESAAFFYWMGNSLEG